MYYWKPSDQLYRKFNERNRSKNLAMLKIILQKIVLKYPNAEFISSNQLTNLIV